MRIDLITCVPDLVTSPLQTSIIRRAQAKGVVEIQVHNLRDYAVNKHGQIDDYPYGGGAGMVLMIQPIAACIRKLQHERTYDAIIYLTPDGERLTQPLVNRLSLARNIILLAGHYKGVDQRVRDLFITQEISIGDYVLSGGELPALVIIDALVRLVPGVLGDETSALLDSFQDGLLAPPVYTRPETFEGLPVPDVLLSGHFGKIDAWRDQQAQERTARLRPDLLEPSES
jgi:tRNA (guanine37-N1)-methyltransferase